MTPTQSVSIWRNFGPLFLLVLGGSFVYALPYFRYYYYDTFLSVFNLNNSEMGNLQTAYGVCAICSFFPGGWLADRVSARKLLTISLGGTGILGFWLYTIPSYHINLLIHGLWGVTTILTFWPAMVKAVRMLAAANEQGKAFGFMESGRGIFNALHMTAALALFTYFSAEISAQAGLMSVVLVYSISCTLVGVLLFLVLKDNEKEISKGSSWSDIYTVLSMPHTWLIVLIIFCSYSMNMSFYYITPYATQTFGASAAFGAFITILANYVRPFSSAGAGVLGDRFGSSRIISFGFVIMAIGLVGLIFVPDNQMAITFMIIFSIFIYISMYIIQGLHYALLEEGEYPISISGTAVGVVATLGYLPEAIIPQIAGPLLDNYPGGDGYRYLFIVLTSFATFGLFITIIWMRMTKEKRMKLLAMKKQSKETRLETEAATK